MYLFSWMIWLVWEVITWGEEEDGKVMNRMFPTRIIKLSLRDYSSLLNAIQLCKSGKIIHLRSLPWSYNHLQISLCTSLLRLSLFKALQWLGLKEVHQSVWSFLTYCWCYGDGDDRYDNPVCSEQMTATTQAQAQPGNGYIPGWMLWESCDHSNAAIKLTQKRLLLYYKV